MERIWRGEVKMNVIKRNCEIAEFDKTKISQAILKAMKYGSGIVKPKIAETSADEIEEEYGDLLFAVVNLGRHLKVTPEIALTKASDKFVNRFKEMEEKAVSDGKDMAELSAKELDELWEFVKKA